MMISYFNLFVLFDLGFIMLKNCVLMGLMYIGFEEIKDWNCVVEFYVECVCGGVGFMVMGGMVFSVEGGVFSGVVGLFNDDDIVNYKVVMDRVYDVGGKIVM